MPKTKVTILTDKQEKELVERDEKKRAAKRNNMKKIMTKKRTNISKQNSGFDGISEMCDNVTQKIRDSQKKGFVIKDIEECLILCRGFSDLKSIGDSVSMAKDLKVKLTKIRDAAKLINKKFKDSEKEVEDLKQECKNFKRKSFEFQNQLVSVVFENEMSGCLTFGGKDFCDSTQSQDFSENISPFLCDTNAKSKLF